MLGVGIPFALGDGFGSPSSGQPSGSLPERGVFSADGKYLVTAGETGAEILDPATGQVRARWEPVAVPSGATSYTGIDSIGVTRDDSAIVTDNDGYVQRWSLRAVLAAGVDGHPRPLSAFQAEPKPAERGTHDYTLLSQDGTMLGLVSPGSGQVTVWNTVTRRVVARVTETSANGQRPLWITALAFSPDDRVLAMPYGQNADQVWNLTATPPTRVVVKDEGLSPYAFASDDGLVVTSQHGDTTRLIDYATGRQLGVIGNANSDLGGNTDVYNQAANLVAEANFPAQGDVTVWNSTTGQVIASPVEPTSDAGHEQQNPRQIVWLALSPDGTRLVAGSGGAPAWTARIPGH